MCADMDQGNNSYLASLERIEDLKHKLSYYTDSDGSDDKIGVVDLEIFLRKIKASYKANGILVCKCFI